MLLATAFSYTKALVKFTIVICLSFLTLMPTVVLSVAITMIDLSNSDIIASKPIGKGFDAFRRLYRSTCKRLGIQGFEDALKQVVLWLKLLVTIGLGTSNVLCT